MQEFKRKTDTIRWVLTRLTSKRRRGMYGKMKDLFATRLVVIETSRLYETIWIEQIKGRKISKYKV